MNSHGDDISVGGLDPLFSTNVDRLIVDLMFKLFPLSRGMNGMSTSDKCILMHDSNNRSLGGSNDSGNSTDLDIGNLMIIDTLDVNGTITGSDDFDVVAGDTTISSPIHKRMFGMNLGSGNRIHDRGNIDITFRSFLLRKDTANIMCRILGRSGSLLRLVSVGLLDGLVKVANSKGQTDRLARILWLRGH